MTLEEIIEEANVALERYVKSPTKHNQKLLDEAIDKEDKAHVKEWRKMDKGKVNG